MAIQNRRGSYKDFDPQKLTPGEWAVVLDGDPAANDGMATYMCFKPGIVKRMATHEDMEDAVRNAYGSEITSIVDSKFSSATANAAAKLATKRSIDGVYFDGTASIQHYGACSTSASSAAKTVSITNFSAITGAKITVLFSSAITTANSTLNVSGTGAKPIYYNGSPLKSGIVKAGSLLEFVYAGGYWRIVGTLAQDPKETQILYSGQASALQSYSLLSSVYNFKYLEVLGVNARNDRKAMWSEKVRVEDVMDVGNICFCHPVGFYISDIGISVGGSGNSFTVYKNENVNIMSGQVDGTPTETILCIIGHQG